MNKRVVVSIKVVFFDDRFYELCMMYDS